MNRRDFLKTTLATAAATATAGCTREWGHITPTSNHLEPKISIFATENVLNPNRSDDHFVHEGIASVLNRVLPTIGGPEQTMRPVIHTNTPILDKDDLPITGDSPAQDWNSFIRRNNVVPDREFSADVNLLLYEERLGGLKGQAKVPCQTCPVAGHSAAVVGDASRFADMTYSHLNGPWEVRSTIQGRIVTTIHEVGHALGLRHRDGTGTSGTLAPDAEPAEVTPMLGSYIFDGDYQNTMNNFGEEIPTPGGTDAICLPKFNDDLTFDHLRVSGQISDGMFE